MRARSLLCLVLAGCTGQIGQPGGAGGDGRDFTKQAVGPGGLPETINTDSGVMNVEQQYLPGVVDCELGWYTTQAAALQAQAVAARTYLARYLAAAGDGANVPIGPTFQCWRNAVYQRSRDAAAATAGVVARYQGALIYANYDSGADRLAADCSPPAPSAFGYGYATWSDMRQAYLGGARWSGYAWTQIFVTYNEGLSGADVAPTIQNNATAQNRGAFGQYAAACLAANFGYDTAAILRFFYGADLALDGWDAGADACDGLSYQGECQGDVLRWCQDGTVHQADCAAVGQTCAWQDDSVGYNCISTASPAPPSDPPPPSDMCGGVTYQGTCQAGVITWCDAGTLYTFDCASAGQGCGWQDDTIGYNCTTGCGDLDYFGGCLGDSLRWCEGGTVHVYDCAGAGQSCAWQDDTIGYNCI